MANAIVLKFYARRDSSLSTTSIMLFLLTQAVTYGLLISQVASHGIERRASPLDNYPRNTIPNFGGPILYYNGTGPVPGIDTQSPLPAALPNLTSQQVGSSIVQEIVAISSGALGNDSCSICVTDVQVMHIASLSLTQDAMTVIMIEICSALKLTEIVAPATCESYFSGTGGLGPYLAQVLRKMSLATGDMQAFCHYEFGVCDMPPLTVIDESDWFPPKPANRTAAPESCGETFEVLHFSDWHSVSFT
jgi:sphingomyelin phosphodiesterase